mmetsp:Transcript_11959/g.19826  ORF Transcript_11959/g.19826 Transcript_11959/m.19826 type:complete len:156 (-) Transcript_11959:122-589(-)|eukprot:CAMPEP_0119003134 /NCGR_PEP_ID=MMETSP1176-20130426/374_1 /TAXON_ID=265551 /ORGANISM="Synedropsis recta cf, Strain CCMP1620" /LENGTH=155 /DNA_ID=CAMNT_0006954703 /DNA_START=57 /DNA_END=524 /DNA_ORIENTATION=-
MRSFFFFAASILTLSPMASGAEQVEHAKFFLAPEAAEMMTGNAADAGTTHYGDPKDGCMKNEIPFRIQDVPGMICAPKCAFGQCPGDLPAGATATPTCAMQSQDGSKYCALICDPDASTALRGSSGGGECGDATCQPIQGTGICTWDDDAKKSVN